MLHLGAKQSRLVFVGLMNWMTDGRVTFACALHGKRPWILTKEPYIVLVDAATPAWSCFELQERLIVSLAATACRSSTSRLCRIGQTSSTGGNSGPMTTSPSL